MFSSGSRELVTDECPWPLERRIFDPKDTSVTTHLPGDPTVGDLPASWTFPSVSHGHPINNL